LLRQGHPEGDSTGVAKITLGSVFPCSLRLSAFKIHHSKFSIHHCFALPCPAFMYFSNFMVKKQIRIENSVPAHVLYERPLTTFSSFKIQHSSLLYLPLFRTEKIVKEKLLKVME